MVASMADRHLTAAVDAVKRNDGREVNCELSVRLEKQMMTAVNKQSG